MAESGEKVREDIAVLRELLLLEMAKMTLQELDGRIVHALLNKQIEKERNLIGAFHVWGCPRGQKGYGPCSCGGFKPYDYILKPLEEKQQ